MKILYSLVAVVLLFAAVSCNKKADKKTEESKKASEKVVPELKITIDSSGISTFYQSYPKLVKFQNEVLALYKKKQIDSIVAG